jgi:DMSO/TMAO reductase YedYZ heme-binding membrane subunit
MEEFDVIGLILNISIYMGIVGFLLCIFSFLSGMRYIKTNIKYRLHKRLGIVGFAAVSIHACIMLYFHYLT